MSKLAQIKEFEVVHTVIQGAEMIPTVVKDPFGNEYIACARCLDECLQGRLDIESVEFVSKWDDCMELYEDAKEWIVFDKDREAFKQSAVLCWSCYDALNYTKYSVVLDIHPNKYHCWFKRILYYAEENLIWNQNWHMCDITDNEVWYNYAVELLRDLEYQKYVFGSCWDVNATEHFIIVAWLQNVEPWRKNNEIYFREMVQRLNEAEIPYIIMGSPSDNQDVEYVSIFVLREDEEKVEDIKKDITLAHHIFPNCSLSFK